MIEVPIDGKFGKWSDYSKYSQLCGGGTQNRKRKCDSPSPANGGADFIGNRTEICECSSHPFPVNGVFGNWSEYSICSLSCGGGVLYRERKYNSPPPKYGGKDCDGPIREIRSCGETECPSNFKIA